ncbi:MAG: lysophospholipid acyltransferase family protein [Hyphomicrobium sp.]|uniref:lysophospholipid acyltransferase family protein n=1 Tax=Hyphomicrobium sp. TaxID=82 RepID=UPI0039E3CF81
MAGRFVSGLIRTVRRTSSTVYEPADFIDRLRSQVPFIMAMWHGQFMMLPDLNTREYPVEAMVARHGDAELVAYVLSRFGISSIRGAGAGDRKRDRGGAYALRTAVKALENGSIVAMTADIPPRKPRIAGEGVVTLARLSGRPIIPVAAATSRFIVLNTWSKMTVNLPLSKLAWVAADPIFVAPAADDDAIEHARLKIEAALNAVTARAYELANAIDPQAIPDAKAANKTVQFF